MYRFIPARRNDTVKKTGRPKYLPVEVCGDNCDIVAKRNTVMNPDRSRRDIFSNLGALHSLAKLEDLDITD